MGPLLILINLVMSSDLFVKTSAKKLPEVMHIPEFLAYQHQGCELVRTTPGQTEKGLLLDWIRQGDVTRLELES